MCSLCTDARTVARVIITDPDNNNKMADVYQPRKTYRIYRAQD